MAPQVAGWRLSMVALVGPGLALALLCGLGLGRLFGLTAAILGFMFVLLAVLALSAVITLVADLRRARRQLQSAHALLDELADRLAEVEGDPTESRSTPRGGGLSAPTPAGPRSAALGAPAAGRSRPTRALPP